MRLVEKLQARKLHLIFASVSQLSILCFPILIRPLVSTNTSVVYIISLPSPPGQEDRNRGYVSNSIDISCFDTRSGGVAIIAVQFFSHPFLFLVAASVPREIENYRSNIIMEMGQKWGASFTRISRFISLKVKIRVGWE